MLRQLADRYLAVDTRSLGLFRIAFGLLLLGNLYDRLSDGGFAAFYTNDGVFPNHYALFAPVASRIWSPLFGFSTQFEVGCALAVVAVVYVLYTVGYQTWLLKWLTVFCVLSVQNRALFMQNGGHVVMHLVALWTAFLPLGERWSVDALIRSFRIKREHTAAALNGRGWMEGRQREIRNLAFLFVCVNFALIYFFNAIHKNGITWHDGSAVHYVLWQSRRATTLAGFLRMHEPSWLSPMLCFGTLVMEWSLPVLILLPVARKWCRAVALLFIFALHGGISLFISLGAFSYVMMAFSLLLIQTEHWDFLERKLRRERRSRTVLFDESDAFQLQLMRLVARLDGFALLQFEHEPSGQLRTGSESGKAAHLAIVRALPLGALWGATLARLMGASQKTRARIVSAFALDRRLESDASRPSPFAERLREAAFLLSQGAAVLIAFAVASQLLLENRAVLPILRPSRRPQWMSDTIEYLRIPQGWSMFAPDAPTTDVRLVVDARLADGTHIDPLTNAPPDFEAPLHGPFLFDVQWCEYHDRVRGSRNLWRGLRDYLARTPELRGWPPEKQLTAFEVYEVTSDSPPPGAFEPTNLKRHLLFRSTDPL
ncbi:MAG: HTTM domain-containing protein [Myxococcaceae bacterium]